MTLRLWGPRAASVLFATLSCLLFAITTFNPASFHGARTGATDAFAPLIAAINKPITEAAGYVRTITGLAHLQAENERLEQENMHLREWHQAALKLQAENQTFQKLLNVKTESARGHVTARIIADSGNAYVKSLLVLAGTHDGVKKGQAALSADGLIGRVVEAGDRSARILLLTDINARIPVLVENKNWHAIMAGDNSENPTLLHLPQERKVKDGMRIVTSGRGGLLPPGLPIGKVRIDEDGRARIALFADTQRITYVRVVDRIDNPNLQLGTF